MTSHDNGNKDHWKGPQMAKMTPEDMQQMSQDLKKLSPASKRAVTRGTFTPKNAKPPF
jgi:hypothetical protein